MVTWGTAFSGRVFETEGAGALRVLPRLHLRQLSPSSDAVKVSVHLEKADNANENDGGIPYQAGDRYDICEKHTGRSRFGLT